MFSFNCQRENWAHAVKLLRVTPKSRIHVAISAEGCTISNRGISYLVPIQDFQGETAFFALKGIQVQAINTFPEKELSFRHENGYLQINTTRFRL